MKIAVWLPLAEHDGKRSAVNAAPNDGAPARAERGARGPSLMMTLGCVEGAVLTYLEAHGSTLLQDLIRKLEWSASVIRMGVGALIREGLVEGRQLQANVLVSLR